MKNLFFTLIFSSLLTIWTANSQELKLLENNFQVKEKVVYSPSKNNNSVSVDGIKTEKPIKKKVVFNTFIYNQINSIEPGTTLELDNITPMISEATNIIAKVNEFYDNLRRQKRYRFALGFSPPSTLQYNNGGGTFIGFDYPFNEGAIFDFQGVNFQKTKLKCYNTSFNYPFKLKTNTDYSLKLYFYSYYVYSRMVNGNNPSELIEYKEIAKIPTFQIDKNKEVYSVTIFFDGKDFDLSIE